jgi:hypothetical protein
LGCIGNADQTPVFFDKAESTTINSAGKRTMQIRITGSEKQHRTVMQATTVDGQKLLPYVIFKWKMMAKKKHPQGIYSTGPGKWLGD